MSCARSTRTTSRPTRLAVREPSLDDVFLALTGHRAEADERSRATNRSRAGEEERHERRHGDEVTADVIARPGDPVGRLRDTLRDRPAEPASSYMRVPQLLVFSTMQPIIFVLMFRFVFGGCDQATGGASRTSTT